MNALRLQGVLVGDGHVGRETKYCRAARNPFIPQPVVTQALALGLVEPRGVHMGPLLELGQVPLGGTPSHSTQLGVTCRLAGAGNKRRRVLCRPALQSSV